MPGSTIEVWFEAKEQGTYQIPCAELCGFGHSGMKGTLTVNRKRTTKWLKDTYANQ